MSDPAIIPQPTISETERIEPKRQYRFEALDVIEFERWLRLAVYAGDISNRLCAVGGAR